MANPAELLHELLLSWKTTPHKSAATLRGISTNGGWESTIRAVRLLDDLMELLRRAKEDERPVPIAENYLTVWTQMVFAYPNGWMTPGNSSTHDSWIDALGLTASAIRDYVPTFDEGGAEHLDAFLRAIEAHLDGDDSYVAMHAKRVCAHLKKLLADVEAYGEFRIVDAMSDLQRILDELAETRPDDPFWKRAATATWSWFKEDVGLVMITGMTVAALTSATTDGLELVESFVQQELSAGGGHHDSSADDAPAEADTAASTD